MASEHYVAYLECVSCLVHQLRGPTLTVILSAMALPSLVAIQTLSVNSNNSYGLIYPRLFLTGL